MPSPVDTKAAADLLGRLVACPSVNPAGLARRGGRASTEPPYGEARLADLVGELVSGWGAEVRIQEVSPGRPNLVARFEGANPDRRLVLEAHGDTVQVEDMTIPPFEPTVREGRLYGRGACDTKASMAAMLLGVRAVLDESGKPPATVLFVSTCDEEMGAGGARALVAGGEGSVLSSPGVDLAVVGEPTGLAVVHAHKGAVRWRIRTHGVAAHSSEPSRGVNAISEMRHLLEALEAIEGPIAEGLRGRRHPLLGEPTISVGTISGGTQVNVVPSLCEIELDRRTVPGESREEVEGEIARELERLSGTHERFEYSWNETQRYPSFEEPPDGPVATMVAGACRKVLGSASLLGVHYATNAGIFKEAGIPCVVFGPGDIAQAHTAAEYVELEQVAKAAEVYAEIIRAFGRSFGS